MRPPASKTHGTSWRDGPAVIGITNGGTGSDGGPGDPRLRDLSQTEPEESKSYELGFKVRTFEQRATMNLALYSQKFDGLIYRGLDGAWEVSLFAKNLTETEEMLSLESVPVTSTGSLANYFGPSGYFNARFTPRREIGLNVRYAFGSR